ncbi:MAG: hypothetical protein IPM29_27880 [Planctomycetes bacterium]|nr:hypothetical protein [Planctomycetota bacterium]
MLRSSIPALLSAALAAQTTEWTTEPYFAAATGSPLAYDAARARVVLVNDTQTWENDGVQWQLREPDAPHGRRSIPAVAYDARRRVVVLFGGNVGGGPTGTWEWDGLRWQRVATVDEPSPRWMTGLAYDDLRGVMVLYGGEGQGPAVGDTWEYDGSTWTLRPTATVPTPRLRHRLVYDSGRGVVVLFGGMDASANAELDETWEYDGVDWVRRTSVHRPPARRQHAMAYDARRARTVVFGGAGSGVDPALVWEWDGVDWSAVRPPTGPTPTLSTDLTYDVARGEVVLLDRSTLGVALWAWDGAAWTRTVASPAPGGRDTHAMAFDRERGAVVLFGGEVLGGYLNFGDTWERRGGVWRTRSPTTSPPARAGHAMEFDPVGRGVLLFGGSGPTLFDDTWLWTGGDWQQVGSGARPPARTGHAMAADTRRNRVVLFGGAAGVARLDDTWEWDGSTWTRRNPTTVPPARVNHGMVFDPVRGRTVMFGGGDLWLQPTLGDHWEWDGIDWRPVTPSTLPPSRAEHGMAFDDDRGVVVMTGGYWLWNPAIPVPRSDTWEWDGVDWAQRTTGTTPASRTTYRVAYDAVLRRTVLFGGDLLTDTWSYGAVRRTEAESFATACPGSRGAVEVTARGVPSLGNRFFALRVSSALDAAPVAIALSLRRVALPLPGGCVVYVENPELCVSVAGPRGAVDIPLALPNDPSLHGQQVFVQGVALDAGGPLGGVAALSAGLRLRLD